MKRDNQKLKFELDKNLVKFHDESNSDKFQTQKLCLGPKMDQ